MKSLTTHNTKLKRIKICIVIFSPTSCWTQGALKQTVASARMYAPWVQPRPSYVPRCRPKPHAAASCEIFKLSASGTPPRQLVAELQTCCREGGGIASSIWPSNVFPPFFIVVKHIYTLSSRLPQRPHPTTAVKRRGKERRGKKPCRRRSQT